MKPDILVVEDAATTLQQLTKLIPEATNSEVAVVPAGTIAAGIQAIDDLKSSGRFFAAAVVDMMVPLQDGETPQLVEPLIEHLTKNSPKTVIIFISAYDKESDAARMRAEYTAEPGDAGSYFVAKKDVDWGDQVVRRLKAHLYGPAIRAELTALFGETPKNTSPVPAGRMGGRLSGIGSRLEMLTYQIRRHFLDVDDKLQSDIRQYFEVDPSDPSNIKAGLKLRD